jgi:hypothetical protein
MTNKLKNKVRLLLKKKQNNVPINRIKNERLRGKNKRATKKHNKILGVKEKMCNRKGKEVWTR